MSEKITASITVSDETITAELNTAARGPEGPSGSGGGGDALVADPLSQFAATTSAQLAGVLTDETGTGAAVFATSPTLTSPVLNTGVSGTAILDEDDLASDSDTQLATQQSIKAYVDDAIKAVTITAKVNEAGGITKGQVVFISGATGGFPQVSLADNTDFSKADILAVATETKTDGQNVAITLSGSVETIDTSAYTEGAILYLGTSGNITVTHPTGINAVQRIGHAVKINANSGSILVELDGLTVINDHDGIMRHQIVNQNAGTSASAAYTIVNDAEYRSSLSMVGSNYAVVDGISNSLVIYNEGYNKTVNAVDGNYGFEWWTDETDSHNLTSTSKMSLTADGELNTLCQTIDHTATEADDHALEIDCDAAGFGDVKAIDVAYDTGAITTGQDEAVILVNIDESASTGGDVTALEVLATEGSANINGMLTGVGVNPIEQLSGVFSDMDSALVNATDRLTEFTTAGSDVQMFIADNDTVTIGSSAKFEEIEFLLAIAASARIAPTFDFSTGSGTWTEFTPVDGTNGMRNTGVIAWLDGDIPTWAVGTGGEYLIRITRTRNNISTPPTESKVQIAAATEHKWDKDGDLSVNTITATGNVDSANTGANAPVSTAQQTAIDSVDAKRIRDWSGASNGRVIPRTNSRIHLLEPLAPPSLAMIEIGDSWSSGNSYQNCTDSLASFMSFGGGIESAANMFQPSGGVTLIADATTDSTRSPTTNYWTIPNGESVVMSDEGDAVLMRKVHIFSTGEDGAGTFKVEEDTGSGYVSINTSLDAVDTDTANVTPSPIVSTWDWADNESRKIRVTCTSGTVIVWGICSTAVFTTNGASVTGIEQWTFARNGRQISQFLATPQTFFDALYGTLKPDVVTVKFADDEPEYAQLPDLVDKIESILPDGENPDIVLIGRHPTAPFPTTVMSDIDEYQRQLAVDEDWWFVSPRQIAGDYDYLLSTGLVFTEDGLHWHSRLDTLTNCYIMAQITLILENGFIARGDSMRKRIPQRGASEQFLTEDTGDIETVYSLQGAQVGRNLHRRAIHERNYREGYFNTFFHFAYDNQRFLHVAGNGGFGNSIAALPISLKAGHTFIGNAFNDPALSVVNTTGNSSDFLFSVYKDGSTTSYGTLAFAVENDGSMGSRLLGAGLRIEEGANGRIRAGAKLVAGVKVEANTTVTTDTMVSLTKTAHGGTSGVSYVVTVVDGVSFTITSTNADGTTATGDTSTFDWMLTERT